MLASYRYLLVGSGRTATHFQHYGRLLGLPLTTWDRSQSPHLLQEKLGSASHVLILISDSAISDFVQEQMQSFPGRILHFSGALQVPGTHSVHPLMSFTPEIYTENPYRQISFVTSSSLPAAELLPGFPNPVHRISPEQQAYYHALCVMSGNFTTLLWQKMANGLQALGLPAGIENLYREQIFHNVRDHLSSALTGPLVRKDLLTVQKNMDALRGDPFQPVYRAFLDLQFPEAASQLKGSR